MILKPGTGTLLKLGSWNDLSNAEYSFDLTSGIWSNNVFGNSTNLFAVNQSVIKSSCKEIIRGIYIYNVNFSFNLFMIIF